MANYLTFIAGSDIDYFYEIGSFLKAGDACLSKPLGFKVGGCVLNAASVCSKLGSSVNVIDYLKKDDEGTKLIVDALNSKGVDTTYIKYGEDVTNGTCLIMIKDDEKCIYVIEPKRPYYIEDSNLKDLLFNSKYIYSLMHTLRISFKDLTILKEAKQKGVKFIFDAQSQYEDIKDIDVLFSLASGIFINEASYQRLKDKVQKDPFKDLFDTGLEFVCITKGSKGADLVLKETIIHEDAKPVKVVDSTGAGDSFAGSFIHYLDKGLSYKEALKRASYVGALACTYNGGMSSITEEDLNNFINNSN